MPDVEVVAWQLFLVFPLGPRRAREQPRKPPVLRPTPVTWKMPGQLALFPARLDHLRFSRDRHVNPDNPLQGESGVMAEERKFDPELLEGAVRIVAETGEPNTEVAEDQGINETTLAGWVSRATGGRPRRAVRATSWSGPGGPKSGSVRRRCAA